MATISSVTSRLAESMPWLDRVAERLHATGDPLFGADGPNAVKDALYGVWMGHPLHPSMTDLPIGFWTASLVLDAAGMEAGADITLGAGLASAAGAAATGFAQWHDLQELDEPRRLGALHALINVAATGVYATSFVMRKQGSRGAGQALAVLGYGLVSASSWIGGDLSYRLGIGVSRTAFDDPAAEWVDAVAVSDLQEGEPYRAEIDGTAVALVKQGESVHAVSATCTHVGGPLDEGAFDGTCLTCPWHGSVFDVTDGSVVHGPATSPLTAFETRISDGQVQVRVAG